MSWRRNAAAPSPMSAKAARSLSPSMTAWRLGRGCKPSRSIFSPRPRGPQLVTREAGDVGAVDEELRLGHAQGEKVGDVVMGNGVAIAEPLDVAVDAAKPIGDAGRVVRVRGQREQMGSFVLKAIERTLTVALARVDDAIEPDGELGAKVVAVAKRAAVEKPSARAPKNCARRGAWRWVFLGRRRGVFRSVRRRRDTEDCRSAVVPPIRARRLSGCRTCTPRRSRGSAREGAHVAVHPRRRGRPSRRRRRTSSGRRPRTYAKSCTISLRPIGVGELVG